MERNRDAGRRNTSHRVTNSHATRVDESVAFSAAVLLLFLAVCLAGESACAMPATAGRPPPAEERSATRGRDPVTVSDQWPAPGGDSNGTYFSPLTDINVGNVARLGLAWEYRTHTTRGLEATPLVIDGVMYTTGPFGRVYSLDATSGRERWTYDPQVDGQWGRFACCDAVNRGVAAAGGRIYVGALDGWLHAIDARTGRRVWKVDTLVGRSEHRPYTITGAPLIAGNLVVIGNGGGEFAGARGYVSAYDITSGELRWRFFTVPRNPAEGAQDQAHLTAAVSTWDSHHPWDAGSGGNVWDGMAYDASLHLVYIGTANPGPYNSHLGGRQGGDELYGNSIIAIKADSGEMAWYYQTVPGDRWDYDSTQKLVLADLEVAGTPRKVLMQASKNGFYYIIDRASGELLSAQKFAYVSWTRGIDAHTGRPILDPSSNYDAGPALVFPSEFGAHTWQPMAFDAKRGLTFIPTIEAGNVMLESTERRAGYVDGQFTTPAFVLESYDPPSMHSLYGSLPSLAQLAGDGKRELESRGFLRAWDVTQHRVVWEVQTASPFDGGVLATAGGLVFQGDVAGQLNAYAADTGLRLASISLGTSIMAAPMTYRVHGVQYVAVMAGFGGGELAVPFKPATAAYRYGNEGRIIVLKVGGVQPKLPPPYREAPVPALPTRPVGGAQIADGEVLYNRYCSRCHVFGRGVLPDLRRLDPPTHQIFDLIVRGGVYAGKGMGRFDDVLSETDVHAIHAYLINQAWEAETPRSPR